MFVYSSTMQVNNLIIEKDPSNDIDPIIINGNDFDFRISISKFLTMSIETNKYEWISNEKEQFHDLIIYKYKGEFLFLSKKENNIFKICRLWGSDHSRSYLITFVIDFTDNEYTENIYISNLKDYDDKNPPKDYENFFSETSKINKFVYYDKNRILINFGFEMKDPMYFVAHYVKLENKIYFHKIIKKIKN